MGPDRCQGRLGRPFHKYGRAVLHQLPFRNEDATHETANYMPFRAAFFGSKVPQEPLGVLRKLSEATALCLRAAVFAKTRRMNRDGLSYSPLCRILLLTQWLPSSTGDHKLPFHAGTRDARNRLIFTKIRII